ncbi:DUF6881 domain-containing protein [Bradyrhizobium betae]|uniref:DUF6881 domain-containing protein n=1 Tax=Bradyrhizobium betae TaxID=244734 RepID=A0A5P6PB57_9BRAD|nr:hypothetical protein [Bradyrhizobium betae]MCS3726487.1 hypothetical protein [Bradyrhizobium betae]QFI75512.1 hypothetical protein F8237_25830 [Bradyrhizobium betae]
MTYLKVKWIHAYPNQPVLIYSELDHDRWELRKVEIFPDGRMLYADPEVEFKETGLSMEPLPSFEKIAADPEFEPEVISKAEFERIWAKATA